MPTIVDREQRVDRLEPSEVVLVVVARLALVGVDPEVDSGSQFLAKGLDLAKMLLETHHADAITDPEAVQLLTAPEERLARDFAQAPAFLVEVGSGE